MNCQNCNTSNEYRFLTHCVHCHGKIEQSHPLSVPDLSLQPVESTEKGFTWTKRVINLGYVFASSIAGMISGSVVVYFAAVITYALFLPDGGNASERCARGAAIGFLSIVSGAYLGTVAGSVFAAKRPLCKGASK